MSFAFILLIFSILRRCAQPIVTRARVIVLRHTLPMMASKFDSPQKADRQRRSNRCDFTRNLGTPPLIFTHSACSARFRTKPVPGLARQGLCRVFRVEVTTGHRTSTGRLTRPIKDGTRFDVARCGAPGIHSLFHRSSGTDWPGEVAN
jgi:hypothetical protein